jgi:hypothetical protein
MFLEFGISPFIKTYNNQSPMKAAILGLQINTLKFLVQNSAMGYLDEGRKYKVVGY